MVKYSKPVWQMVREAAEELKEFAARDVKEFIRDRYTGDNVNEATIGAQVIACSVNHPSAHHYPDRERFLFYLGNGRYRMASPEEIESYDILPEIGKTITEHKSEGKYFVQLKNGQIRIPRPIIQKMALKNHDFLALVEDDEGNVILKRAELRIVD